MDKRLKKMIGMMWMVLLVGNASLGFAAVDCYIQPWGAPPYQTPDIWTDNNGNGIQECGEPSLGISNRLWARIHNIGTTTATNVLVKFYYAPYSIGYPHTHFKQIGAPVSIPMPITGGTSIVIETAWDLSNLSEDNGGLWPYPIASFDHFCVRVVIDCAADVNPGNNAAQNNFTAVPCSECGFNFIIVNPTEEQVSASLITSDLPKGWSMSITAPGIKNIHEFGLAPHETKLAKLRLFHPEDQDKMNRDVDVGLTLDGDLVGGVTFRAVKPPARRFNSLSFHVGCAIPTGGYSDTYQSGYSLITDIDFYLWNKLSAVLIFGYNDLQARVPSVNDTHWWNISGNLKMEFTVSPNIDLYLNGGVGAYIPQSGSTEQGINVGLGWNYRLAHDCRLEFGHDYHRISGGPDAEFIVTHIGAVFRY